MTTREDHQPLAPRAAWYPDDADQSLLRYWDGARWTKHVRPAPAESLLDGAVAAEGTGWVRRHRPEMVLLLGWALLAGTVAVAVPGGSDDSSRPGGSAAPSATVESAPSNGSPSEDEPAAPSERDVSGCALEVQPMVTPIAREAESTQRSLLEEARLAANELPPGSSRQRCPELIGGLRSRDRSSERRVRAICGQRLSCRSPPDHEVHPLGDFVCRRERQRCQSGIGPAGRQAADRSRKRANRGRRSVPSRRLRAEQPSDQRRGYGRRLRRLRAGSQGLADTGTGPAHPSEPERPWQW